MVLQLSGFKKVLNYTKKVMEDVKYRKTVTREEVICFLFWMLDFVLESQNAEEGRIALIRFTVLVCTYFWPICQTNTKAHFGNPWLISF